MTSRNFSLSHVVMHYSCHKIIEALFIIMCRRFWMNHHFEILQCSSCNVLVQLNFNWDSSYLTAFFSSFLSSLVWFRLFSAATTKRSKLCWQKVWPEMFLIAKNGLRYMRQLIADLPRSQVSTLMTIRIAPECFIHVALVEFSCPDIVGNLVTLKINLP